MNLAELSKFTEFHLKASIFHCKFKAFLDIGAKSTFSWFSCKILVSMENIILCENLENIIFLIFHKDYKILQHLVGPKTKKITKIPEMVEFTKTH